MNGLLADLKYSLRALAKAPGFTALAIGTLAVGIGASTLAFSMLESLLRRPFPFPDLERLVNVWEEPPASEGGPQVHRRPLTPGDYLDLRREARSFEKIAAFRYRKFRLTATGGAVEVRGVAVDPGFFETLGVRPAIGAVFAPPDYEPGRDRTAILSDGFFRQQLGADPATLAGGIVLDGERYTIRGVMPPQFHYPLGPVHFWTPLALGGVEGADRSVSTLYTAGRLKRSVGLAAARAEIAGIARQLESRYPRANADRRLTILPLSEQQAGLTKPLLVVFAAAAAFVFLVACANVANLLLVRAIKRRGEIAVRRALGASRWQIGRQLAVESLLLSAGGLALSLWLVDVGLEGLRKSLPQGIAIWLAGWRSIGLQWQAFGFAASTAAGTAVLFGLFPLARLREEGPALDVRGKTSHAFGRRAGVSGSLVVAQVGLALMLLAGAAATVQGFNRVVGLYDALDPDHVITMHLALPGSSSAEPSRSTSFFGRLVSEVGMLPTVEAVAAVTHLPADLGPIPTRRLRIDGRLPADEPTVDLQTITPDYFRALHLRWIRGRMFNDGDGPDSPPVAILSESASRLFFPRGDSIGARVAMESPGAEKPWLTIVGVVADVQQYWFDRQPRPTLYVPLPQSPRSEMFLLIRGDGHPTQTMEAVRDRVRQMDPGQSVEEVRTLRGVVDESASLVRIAASVLVVTSLLALLLGAVGIFGVVTYTAARATRDIGIRMALGARASHVVRWVVGGAARLFLLGAALGLLGAVVLTRVLSALLFGIAPADLMTFAFVALLLLAVTAAACYIPARRATKVDPADALRTE